MFHIGLLLVGARSHTLLCWPAVWLLFAKVAGIFLLQQTLKHSAAAQETKLHRKSKQKIDKRKGKKRKEKESKE